MGGAKRRNIWMIIDHPQQMAIALGITDGLSAADYAFNLLISPHPYWNRVDINTYRERFSRVIRLERPEYSWNPLRNFGNILMINRLKARICGLGIAP